VENIAGFGIGGASWATMGRLASLQIGDFVVERPVVQFNTATKGIEASDQFDGIIGADILSRFIVTLDYQNQRMMLRKGARFEQPFEYDMSGLYFVTAGDRNDVFKVENVIKDSPAAKAGIEKGDVLVSIDHKPVSSFTLETLKRHLREAGRVVALQVQRAGKTKDISFRLERLI
jgi:C-terminal processing protease CtpA/Prc